MRGFPSLASLLPSYLIDAASLIDRSLFNLLRALNAQTTNAQGPTMNASSTYSEEEIAAYARLYEGNLIPMYATGEFIVHRLELGSSVHTILVRCMHG